MHSFEEFYKKLKENNSIKIVEGKKDKKALESLEINKVFPLNGKPLHEIIEKFQDEKEIILLTDLDYEGKKLYSSLSKQFEKEKVKINNKFRKFLFEYKITNIESLK